MPDLKEIHVNDDVWMFYDGPDHFGSVMRTGKSWCWTHCESNRFGFTDSKGDAVSLVHRIFKALVAARREKD